MALFTDTGIVSLDDLLQYENSLVQISSTHGINVDTKINLSVSALGDKLLYWLLNVKAADPQWANRREIGLSTVVVTPAVHRWLCFDSLARFFEEAYNTQLNTRFQGKWTEYQKLGADTADVVFMTGIGVVDIPLPRPEMPAVSIQGGGTLNGPLFVRTAWVDSGGNEGALSPVNASLLSSDFSVGVAMSDGSVPGGALGWNVYGSTTAGGLTRQNNAPLTPGSTWHLPASGLVAGADPVDGQNPNAYVTLSRRIQRG